MNRHQRANRNLTIASAAGKFEAVLMTLTLDERRFVLNQVALAVGIVRRKGVSVPDAKSPDRAACGPAGARLRQAQAAPKPVHSV